MRRSTIAATAAVIVLGIVVAGRADENDNLEAENAVRKVAATYVAAFNKRDAKALANLWTPEGDFIGPRGERLRGRDEIRKDFESFFAVNQQTRLSLHIGSVHLIGNDVAVVDGTAEVTPPLEGPPVEARSTVVLVKRGDGWLIESARDSLVSVPSNYDHLKQLEWMIGDWQDAATDREAVFVQSSCDWTVNKNYIIRKFTAEIKGGVSRSGTQLIGWDPREHRIRSWVFDSAGGFGEGTWKHEGNRWIVEVTGVLRDGSEGSATNIVTYLDEDTLTFESRNRTIGGQEQPDVGPVTIKRRTVSTDAQGGSDAQEQPARETVLPP